MSGRRDGSWVLLVVVVLAALVALAVGLSGGDDTPTKSREQVCVELCGPRGVRALTVWGCTCNRTGLLR